jgi:anhydro-N-acetylmuramic acid kinase
MNFLPRIFSQELVTVVGLMAGTSADGVDVALCTFNQKKDNTFNLIDFSTYPYSLELRARINSMKQTTIREVAELNFEIGSFFAESTKKLLKQNNLTSVDLIGSHGQTVYHHSSIPNALRCTLQLGCADTIAVELSAPVVSDFRPKDIAAGGQGAPLTPYGDLKLYNIDETKAVLNVGGIANFTLFDHGLKGFDTGPGNSILDRLVQIYTSGNEFYDADGQYAAKGKINLSFIDSLFSSDNYVQQEPPKSTGFEMYGDTYVLELIKKWGGIVDLDLIATATYFVAKTIALQLRQFGNPLTKVLIVAGGGSRNKILLSHLAEILNPIEVKTSEQYGVDSKAREAITFALLAYDAVSGVATSIPGVTGANTAEILGKLSFPPVKEV